MSPLKIAALTAFLAFILYLPLKLGISLHPLITNLGGLFVYVLIILGLIIISFAVFMVGLIQKFKERGLQQKTLRDKLIFWGIISLIIAIFCYKYIPQVIR